jgi:hypothetical protein
MPEKSKEDRLKETIRLLKELGRLGYSAVDKGYNEVKAVLTKWVNDGEPVDVDIEFPDIIAWLRYPYRRRMTGRQGLFSRLSPKSTLFSLYRWQAPVPVSEQKELSMKQSIEEIRTPTFSATIWK